jgi:hypothetical protein
MLYELDSRSFPTLKANPSVCVLDVLSSSLKPWSMNYALPPSPQTSLSPLKALFLSTYSLNSVPSLTLGPSSFNSQSSFLKELSNSKPFVYSLAPYSDV